MHLHGSGGGPGAALGTRPVAAAAARLANPDSAIGGGAGPAAAAAARSSALSPAAVGAVGWPRGPRRGRAPADPSPLVSSGRAGLLVAAPLRLRHSCPGKGGRRSASTAKGPGPVHRPQAGLRPGQGSQVRGGA